MSNYQINTSALSGVHTARSTARHCAVRETAPQVGDFEGWVTLRLHFRLMVTFLANICGPLDRGMVHHNFAAGSFHTKKLRSRLYSTEFDFYSKNEKIAFWATRWGLRGNIRTLSIARWKAHGRLPIRHNWTFFAISYGWDVISGNLWKSSFFEGDGPLWAQISSGRGVTQRPLLLSEWVIPLSCGIKISAVYCFVLSQSTLVTDTQTDRRTDRRTELWQLILR